jgi:hypothetical protein
MDRLNHQVSQVLPRRDLDLELVLPVLELLGGELFVGRNTGLALRLPGAGGHADPFQFPLQCLLPRRGRLFFLGQPLLLLLEP